MLLEEIKTNCIDCKVDTKLIEDVKEKYVIYNNDCWYLFFIIIHV